MLPNPSTAPGGLRVGVLPDTLVGFCYLRVAYAIAKEPIAVCDECNLPFVVDDKRQKFCEPACANRARFRRFKTNQTAKTTSKKKTTPKRNRSRHGKDTKTR